MTTPFTGSRSPRKSGAIDSTRSPARPGSLRTRAPADLAVEVISSTEPQLVYDPVHRRRTDESFVLGGGSPGEPIRVTVSGTRSLRWALIELEERIRSSSWDPDERLCGPSFALRGVIEGYYGPPWNDEARLDMIDFAASKRLNTFLYAPKDDPYLRRHWRTPHEAEWRQRLERLIEHCRSLDVDPVIGVSPGLSMRYSSPEDSGLLEEKVLDLVGLGASRIALLLDDIPDRLQHPADIEAFPDLATAHAETANRIGEVLAEPGYRWWSVRPSIGVMATRSTSADSPVNSTLGSICSGQAGRCARRPSPPPRRPVSPVPRTDRPSTGTTTRSTTRP